MPEQTQPLNRKKILIIAIAAVLVIAICVVLYFALRTPSEVQPLISIENMLLASSVDENYNYVARANNTYKKGDIVIIYHEVKNIKTENISNNYLINFNEVHELIDSDNISIQGINDENGFSRLDYTYNADLYSTKVKSGINTALLAGTGEYTYRITVINLLNLQDRATKEITFVVRE